MTLREESGSSSAPPLTVRGTHIPNRPSSCSASTTGSARRPSRSPYSACRLAISATRFARPGRSIVVSFAFAITSDSPQSEIVLSCRTEYTGSVRGSGPNVAARQPLLRTAPPARRASGPSGEIHRLQLEVELEAFDAALAPDARLLEAAERHLRVDDHAVHRHAAGAHPPRDLVAALRVRRIDGAVQAVDRIVGLLDRVVDVVVRDERHDRAEDFLARDRHPVVDVGEDGRLDEVAAVEAFRAAAAEHEARPFLLAHRDEALHALQLPLHRERTHLRRGLLRVEIGRAHV